MHLAEAFEFFSKENLLVEENSLTITLSIKLKNHLEVLKAYYDLLNFPNYFGFNWDALEECLGDFHWIEQKQIVIIHNDLPLLDNKELTIYLAVLADACFEWREKTQHSLRIVFPASEKEKIFELLKSVTP